MIRSIHSLLAMAASLALAGVGHAQFVSYNDHFTGPNTHPNATTWNVYGAVDGAPGNTGPLKDIVSGATFPVVLTITNGGVGTGTTSGAPAPGTPAGITFNPYIDWGSGTINHAIQIAVGQSVGHVFSGLDPNKRYIFKGSSVRGGGYTDRWSLFELADTVSFTSAHTPGAQTSAQIPGLTSNQAIINTGANDATGDMVVWENINPGPDGVFAVVSRQYVGPLAGGATAGGPYGYALQAVRLEEVAVSPVAAAITNQPQDVVVGELQNVTFRVGATGNPAPTYQWFRNGSPITDATNTVYSFRASLSDNNTRFTVQARNVTGSTTNMVTSREALLTVTADTVPPTLVRAGSLSPTQVEVVFSEPVIATGATNPANYTITSAGGPLTISSILLGNGSTNVVLSTSQQDEGTTYTVTVNNLTDQSVAANPLAPNSQITFAAVSYVSQDVGNPSRAGSVTPVTGGYNVTANGNDIFGNSDQFTFGFQQRTGDFDVRVRVESLSLSAAMAKAGLMARESLDANSRFAAVFATPSVGGAFFESRLSTGGSAGLTGSFPVNYPQMWLRLQRVNTTFSGYASFDGKNWVLLGASSIGLPGTVYFGMAVTSQTSNETTVATFRDLGPATGAQIAVTAPSVEGPGPSSKRTGLAITEIMYAPSPRADGRNVEYVEIFNSLPYFEDMSGYRLSGDIDYIFPSNTVLEAGAYMVVAKVPADVQAAYGLTKVMGPYSGSLPDDSGRIRLRSEGDSVLLEVNYSSMFPWPGGASGAGHSLVLARPSFGEDNSKAWARSDVKGGSPGRWDGVGAEALRPLMINEFLANSSVSDYIELHNRSTAPLDISGAYLSDNPTTNKFRIPNGTVVPANGFISFDQAALGFGIKADGDTIFLVSSNQTRVLDAVAYGDQARDVSYGRFPNGSDTFTDLGALTPGSANSGSRQHPIVINELMYAPISGDARDEYVELYNRSTNTVNVGGWRFVDGITFTIPSNTVIAADAYLVVAKDRGRLLTNHPALNPAMVVGDYSGTLANGGERVALAKTETYVSTNSAGRVSTNTIRPVIEEVRYFDGGRWGLYADGGGSSLELINPFASRRRAGSWADSDETTKAPWTTIDVTGTFDNTPSTSGNYTPNSLDIFMLGVGEVLFDDVELRQNGGANLVQNGGFETGAGNTATGWALTGSHSYSSYDSPGFSGNRALHIRAASRGDTAINRVRNTLTAASASSGSLMNIKANARWLGGHPEVLLRLRGNGVEAEGRLIVPSNLGTPGARNSRYVANAGPSIFDVAHAPILPAVNQPIVVTARVSDPDGLGNVMLRYRVDPTLTFVDAPMTDDGTGADQFAGDGVYSASIPGQGNGTLVAFHVQASDAASAPVTATFPANALTRVFPVDAPRREALVRWGEITPAGAFGTYRIYITQDTISRWIGRHKLDNSDMDSTFVYGNSRVVYNTGTLYSGSPWHQNGWNGPLSNQNDYVLHVPPDDQVLGVTDFVLATIGNLGNDPTAQTEQAAFNLLKEMKVGYNHRRYIYVFVNGLRRGGGTPNMMEDVQQPNGDTIAQWYPDDQDGDLYKIEDWFEFNDTVDSHNNVDATLQDFVTTGGEKKKARYRWIWRKRAVSGSANDYSTLFTLVNTISVPTVLNDTYTRNVENLVDVDNWLAVFAVEHAVGNWDSYGFNRGKNMYGYKPQNGRWALFPWDIDFVLGNGSQTPDFFTRLGQDTALTRLYTHPPFRRAYLRQIKRLADGPMSNMDPLLDAKYQAFLKNGVNVNSPQSIKNFVATRLTVMNNLIPNAAFAITSTPGSTFSISSNNLITLTGTAPIPVKDIEVNGIAYPVTWVNDTTWTLRLALNSGLNTINFTARDTDGFLVPGATAQLNITYTGADADPTRFLVINEINYRPVPTGADFIEIHNTSTNISFDLTGWRLNGVDFRFPGGSVIAPGGFKVVVKDRAAFAAFYGASVPIDGQFGGNLDPDGETITLFRPGLTPGSETAISRVRYEPGAPWPSQANGTGSSLELVDGPQGPTRVGNWRSTFNAGGTNYGWRFASTTANIGSIARLYIFLQNIGDVYVDDVFLAMGPDAEVGTNYIRNGDFESPLIESPTPANGFNVPTNYYLSEVTTAVKRSGNSSLHLVSTGTGNTQTRVIYQNVNPAPTGQVATLSFWYLPNTEDNVLNIKMLVTQLDIRAGTLLTNTPPTISSTPGARNSIAAAIPTFEPLWINEVQPVNLTGITDNTSTREPWLEIYNAGSSVVSLDNLFLANQYSNLTQWAFPAGSVLNPGQYKVIFADGQPAQTSGSEWHANFRITPTDGALALSRRRGEQVEVLDYLNYRTVTPNNSYGSYPDGQPYERREFAFPTPGAPNDPAAAPSRLFINEWLASNTNPGGNPDPADGAYDDWFEIYNAGTNMVNLAGYYLTDSATNKTKYVIPAGYTIAPGGFLLVWADNEPNQNSAQRADLHAGFKLSRSGSFIAIYDPNGGLLDSVTFGAQTSNVSEGRYTDGTATIRALAPTPRTANSINGGGGLQFGTVTRAGNGQMSLQVPTVPGKTYRVEYKNSLNDTQWLPLGSDQVASGGSTTFTDSPGATPQRFYRVVQVN